MCVRVGCEEISVDTDVDTSNTSECVKYECVYDGFIPRNSCSDFCSNNFKSGRDGICTFSGCDEISVDESDTRICHEYGCVYDGISSGNSCSEGCSNIWKIGEELSDGICKSVECGNIKGSGSSRICEIFIEKEECMIIGFYSYF
jgi:hypothetical protein